MKILLGKILCFFGFHDFEYKETITSKYEDFIPSSGEKICKRCKREFCYRIDRG